MRAAKDGEDMIKVSEAFADAAGADVIHPASYIVLGDERIVPVSYQLQDAVYDEDSQNFLGTFISRYGEMVLILERELPLQDEQFQLYTGFQLADGSMEYVTQGTFYIYEVQEEQHDIQKTIRFADARILFNKPLQEVTYPLSVKQMLDTVCEQVQVPCMDITGLPNADFIINKEVYWGENATCADVVKAIAQAVAGFALITTDGALCIRWFFDTVSQWNADTYFTLESHDVFGPVNSVVLGRQPQNDNIYLRDEESVKANGLCEFQINDNPILDLDRKTTIQPIFERLKGFSYTPLHMEGKGNPALERGDRLQVTLLQDTHMDSYVFQHELSFDGALISTVETPALTKTQIEYSAADSIEKRILQTELKVDKVKGEITSQIQDTVTKVERIEASRRYEVKVQSSNGTVFRNGDIDTVLSVQILSWDEDITSVVSDEAVSWTRISADTTGDKTWSRTGKSVQITAADFTDSAIFTCEWNGYRTLLSLVNVYDGQKGAPGKAGEDGKTTYFHVKYAPVENPSDDQISETPNSYIGTYVDYSPEDSTMAAAYTWARIQGKDGIPGINGADGKTSYLHIRYSDDGGQTFTSLDGKTPGIYIGQYTDFTQTDSLDVAAYTWAKVKGDNDIISAPSAPERTDCMWLDTSTKRSMLKKYNYDTSQWEVVNDFSADISAVEETILNISSSSLTATKDEIRAMVENGYLTKNEADELEQRITKSIIEQQSDTVTIRFNESKELVEKLEGVVQTNKEEIEKFIRFIKGRIEIGESDSAFSLEITNEKIAFLDRGSEIAYISNSQLVITDANIQNSLSVGKFHFVPRSNGNMSIKYIP
ncbi:hypothetical protein DWW36_03170 [Erysipelotrichaceae bacterium AF15-26LB]|nr:hypothetical protein HMPREF0983_03295 [Erysipelotrichaceae bacterium 3_1_53]RJV91898.1 hypothetical protein DWW36_03170 [Erysipelotrichaceae bacterium AF15-26LB]